MERKMISDGQKEFNLGKENSKPLNPWKELGLIFKLHSATLDKYKNSYNKARSEQERYFILKHGLDINPDICNYWVIDTVKEIIQQENPSAKWLRLALEDPNANDFIIDQIMNIKSRRDKINLIKFAYNKLTYYENDCTLDYLGSRLGRLCVSEPSLLPYWLMIKLREPMFANSKAALDNIQKIKNPKIRKKLKLLLKKSLLSYNGTKKIPFKDEVILLNINRRLNKLKNNQDKINLIKSAIASDDCVDSDNIYKAIKKIKSSSTQKDELLALLFHKNPKNEDLFREIKDPRIKFKALKELIRYSSGDYLGDINLKYLIDSVVDNEKERVRLHNLQDNCSLNNQLVGAVIRLVNKKKLSQKRAMNYLNEVLR